MQQLVLRDFRRNRNGSVWTGMLVLSLLGAAAVGAFVVLYQGGGVTVEARIRDVDTSSDPITAKVDLRLTNTGAGDLVLERVDVAVWADAARTVLLTSGHLTAVLVRAGGPPTTVTIPMEIHHAGELGSSAWVDYHAVWWRGEQRQSADVDGREISVGDALSRIF
jgi:hypothetical protein